MPTRYEIQYKTLASNAWAHWQNCLHPEPSKTELSKLRKSLPRYDWRLIDHETGDALEPRA